MVYVPIPTLSPKIELNFGFTKKDQAAVPPVPHADTPLERLDRCRKRLHATPEPLGDLPDGGVIAAAGEAYTIAHGRAFRWSEQGYQAARQIPHADALLTPPSTLLAIRVGYRPGATPRPSAAAVVVS